MSSSWFDRLLGVVADRGRALIRLPTEGSALEQTRQLSRALLSGRGEASGAALARALLDRYQTLLDADRLAYLRFLATDFAADPALVRRTAEAYCQDPSPDALTHLAAAVEAPRCELLRRINLGPGGTAQLVQMRARVLALLPEWPELQPLEADLKQLLSTWFNRGFLELTRIDWHTPAAILEKLIAYEAVHEIQGWDDLRRRLASDRRCFAFFHPALRDEPLIFVEVALVRGMAGAVQPLLARDAVQQSVAAVRETTDAAIFYSISNCQSGLRGISFGNFLIKQVVEDLKHELPNLTTFATLSPVPGFRSWLDRRIAAGARNLLRPAERVALRECSGQRGAKGALASLLAEPDWIRDADVAAALRPPLTRLCAEYLTANAGGRGPSDPVARFHLGNGAMLARVNFLGNTAPRGQRESYGIMVNYLYDPERIEANHEAFVRDGTVACADEVADLLRDRWGGLDVGSLLTLAGRPVT